MTKAPPEDPMTIEEIRNWYLEAHENPWYQSQMPMTKMVMMRAADVSQTTIDGLEQYDEFIRPNTLDKLTEAIRKIERRRLVWWETSVNGWNGRSSYDYQHFTPPAEPLKRMKFGQKGEFDMFAVCTSCEGNKWLPARLDGKPFVLCYSCLPLSQWPSLGAVIGRYSLIAEYVRLNNARLHL